MTDEEIQALIDEAVELEADEVVDEFVKNEGAPPEMFMNPKTGQMTSRELLANNMQPSQAGAGVTGFYQGGTFGGGDEIVGAINAAVPTEGTAAERYRFGQEYMRAREEAARRNYPKTTAAGEAGGAMTTGLAYGAPAMAGRGRGGAMLAGGGMGALEGGVYGALSGEGASGRLADAAKYAGAGAAVGGLVVPPAVAGLRGAWRAGKDAIGGGIGAVTGKGSQSRAQRNIAKMLQKSGKSPQEVNRAVSRAAAEGQPDYKVMDALGITGQRKASAIARSGGDSAAEIREFLDQRQLDQPERMASFVEDAFDLKGTSAKATREALKEGRDAAANASYGTARSNASPVDVRRALGVIDDRIGGMQGSGVAGDGIDGTLGKFRRRLAAPEDALESGVSSKELSDFNRVMGVKQDVDDAIGAAVRAGRNNEARELSKLKSALDDALADASPSYSGARNEFAASSRVMEAVDTGQDMARPGNRAADTTTQFRNLSPDEQAAARVGYGDRLMQRLEAQSGGANRARPMTSTKARQEAAEIASDPGLLKRRVDREMDMFETRNIAAGGSRTADNQEDIAELAGASVNPIVNMLRGRWADAAAQAGQRGLNAATGMNDSTRQLIAKALMAGDTKALEGAISSVKGADARKAIVDQLLRLGVMTNNPALQ